MMIRSVLEDYFTMHPEALKINISHRFRDQVQYNPQELCYLLAQKEGKAVIRSNKGNYLYLYPRKKKNYVNDKIRQFDSYPNAKFLCINSLNNAEPGDVRKVLTWLEKRIRLSAD